MKIYKAWWMGAAAGILTAQMLCAGVVISNKTASKTAPVSAAEEQTKLLLGQKMQAAAQQACPLYAAVRSELEAYYGRKDFADTSHTSGWYRVEDFLKWVQQNEDRLKKETISFAEQQYPAGKDSVENQQNKSVCTLLQDFDSVKISPQFQRKVLAVYLGARYVADLYVPQHTRFPKIKVLPQMTSLAVASRHQETKKKGNVMRAVIGVNGTRQSFAEDINHGLHEGTHLALWMAGSNDMSGIGEAGSFYVQIRHGLPVKESHLCWASGARNFVHSVQELGSCWPLSQEYAEMLLGALVFNELSPQDLLKWKTLGKHLTVAALMRYVPALEQGKLYWKPEQVKLGPLDEVIQRYPQWSDGLTASLQGENVLLSGNKILWIKEIEGLGWSYGVSDIRVTKNSFIDMLGMPGSVSGAVERILHTISAIAQTQGPVSAKVFSLDNQEVLSEQEEETLLRLLKRSQTRLPPVPQGYL